MLVLKENKNNGYSGFGETYEEAIASRGRLTPQQKKMQEEALAQRERELAAGRIQSEIIRKEQASGGGNEKVGRRPVGYTVMSADETMRLSLQRESDDLLKRQKIEIQQLKNYQNTLIEDIKNKAANKAFKSQAELDNQVTNSTNKVKTKSNELLAKHKRENEELQEKFKKFNIETKATGATRRIETEKQIEDITKVKANVISSADIASSSATKAAANVMKLAGFGRLSGFGLVKPISRGGSGIQRPLFAVSSAIARAKEQAGIPVSIMPVYKSPLLAAREQQAMTRAGYTPVKETYQIPLQQEITEGIILSPGEESLAIREETYQEPSYQISPDFDIESARANVTKMKEAIVMFTAIVVKAKSDIAKAKSDIANGRRQIAAL